MEREKALDVARRVSDCLKERNLVQDIFIGGSIIRKADPVRDVDIGIIPTGVYQGGHAWWKETMQDIFNMFHSPRRMPDNFKIACGKEILRLWYQDIQVDIWAAERYYWGPMCMFIAGSGKLNVIQRVKARKQGVLLSNKGIFTLDGEDIGKFDNERKVYDFLGWEWLPYEKRSL